MRLAAIMSSRSAVICGAPSSFSILIRTICPSALRPVPVIAILPVETIASARPMARFPPMTLPEVFFRNDSSGSLAHRVTFFWDKRENSISLISASMVKILVFRAFDWLFKPFSGCDGAARSFPICGFLFMERSHLHSLGSNARFLNQKSAKYGYFDH